MYPEIRLWARTWFFRFSLVFSAPKISRIRGVFVPMRESYLNGQRNQREGRIMKSKMLSRSFGYLICAFLLLYYMGTASGEEGLADPASSAPACQTTAPTDKAGTPPAEATLNATAIADLRVTGSAFRPRNSETTYAAGADGGCMYATANPSNVWSTPLYLPQGSTVKAVRMYYDDTSATDSRGWFTVYDLYGNRFQEWDVDSGGNSGNGFNDSAAIDHVIDYFSYSYALNWRPNYPGTDMQLCGFRIFYEPPEGQSRAVVIPMF